MTLPGGEPSVAGTAADSTTASVFTSADRVEAPPDKTAEQTNCAGVDLCTAACAWPQVPAGFECFGQWCAAASGPHALAVQIAKHCAFTSRMSTETSTNTWRTGIQFRAYHNVSERNFREARGESRIVERLEHKHPRAIRWLHWINFPLLAIMIWSGMLIYWAYDAYRIGAGGITIFHFFPQWFYNAFHISHRLAEGMAWHFAFMWLFALNGIAYVIYTIVSGEWRYLAPNRQSFREAIQVTLYDLRLTKTPPPSKKFNGAQQIAYTSIILMGAGSILTGLAIYKPVQFAWITTMLGGYRAARVEHFLLTIGYVLFFVVHVAQVIRAGWNNMRSMITGFEVVRADEAAE